MLRLTGAVAGSLTFGSATLACPLHLATINPCASPAGLPVAGGTA